MNHEYNYVKCFNVTAHVLQNISRINDPKLKKKKKKKKKKFGMAMKRRGGTKSKTIERMLNVFQFTFSASEMKAMSRICARKTEKNLQIFG